MPKISLLMIASLSFLMSISALGAAAESASVTDDGCGPDLYFAAGDSLHETPLSRPVPELERTRRAALRGDKRQQRELAVSYEVGDLISVCFFRAAYWYGRAAKLGDEIAAKWIERNASLVKLAQGPECVEEHCNVGDSASGAFYAVINARNAFRAPLTINGVTVEGIVDTGASSLSMGADTAAKLGLSTQGGKLAMGTIANGATVEMTAIVVPMLKVGGITVQNVRAVVGNAGSPTLIGMTVLNKLRLSAAGGNLTLAK